MIIQSNRFTRWICDRIVGFVARQHLRDPDFVIQQGDVIYLERWWVIPRNRFLNVYYHVFHHSDDDRALHDHPWWSVSFMLSKLVFENYKTEARIERRAIHYGDVVFRSGKFAHQMELSRGSLNHVHTLFITGPRFRQWGFHCPKGWVHWKEFTKPGAPGQIGRGCD